MTEPDLVVLLGRISKALDRMVNDLAPLVEEYKEQKKLLPDLPPADSECKICDGTGVISFIDDEGIWKSKYCTCARR